MIGLQEAAQQQAAAQPVVETHRQRAEPALALIEDELPEFEVGPRQERRVAGPMQSLDRGHCRAKVGAAGIGERELRVASAVELMAVEGEAGSNRCNPDGPPKPPIPSSASVSLRTARNEGSKVSAPLLIKVFAAAPKLFWEST